VSEEIELFCCFLCEQYKPVKQRKFVKTHDALPAKEICTDCLERINKTGLTKSEAMKREPKQVEEK